MTFLRYYVLFESSEINHIFDNELKELTERSETMGIKELLLDRAEKKGIQKGIQKGEKTGEKRGERKKAIEAALKMKMSGLESSFIADIVGLSIEEIEKL